MTIAGPRVYFAMARDGLFLAAAARVHPRFRTPALAIVAQALWSGVLVLSGTLSQLLSYTGFAVVLFSGVAVASLFVLRRRDGSSERPSPAWGYPVAPAIFVLASAVLVLNEIVSRPGPALAGLGVMAAGVPVYWWMRADGARSRARQRARATLVGAALVAAALGGTAQAATARAQATTVAVEGIRVDGVLDQTEWARAVPIGVLVQRDPVEGAPASEETEVRVAFDADNLYFGILCRDRTPEAIVATQLGRDADLDVDDRVTIVLDPFFDQRNGFFFSVNPAGARADGQISNNEQEPSLEWDGIWDARTRITGEGWAAEVALPFKTLRFRPGQTTWGLNVERQIKRLDERDRWASARFDAWISNLAEAGQLAGLAGLQQGRGLDIRPYVSGGEETSDATAKVGLDVSKSLTPEPDGLADREHRLRGDRGGRPADQPHPLRPVLPREAHVLPRRRGRLRRGRVARGGRPGPAARPRPLLQPHDRAARGAGGADPARGEGLGSSVGVQHRRPRRADAPGDARGGRAAGAEPARRAREPQLPRAVVGRGDRDPRRPDRSRRQHAARRRRTPRHVPLPRRQEPELRRVRAAHRRRRERPGRPRLRRPARVPERPLERLARLQAHRRRLPPGARIRAAHRDLEVRRGGRVSAPPRAASASASSASGPRPPWSRTCAGDKESWEVFTALPDIEFDSGEEIGLNWVPTFDRLTFPFEIRPGVVIPPGSYRWSRYQAEVSSATKRPWVVEVALWWGGFYGGTLQQLESSLTLKPSTHLSLQLQLERNDVALPEGDFVTQLLSARVDYNASPNVTWSNLVQYDSDSRILGLPEPLPLDPAAGQRPVPRGQPRLVPPVSTATTCRASTRARRSSSTPSACERALTASGACGTTDPDEPCASWSSRTRRRPRPSSARRFGRRASPSTSATTARTPCTSPATVPYDAIVLDIMLPGRDGLSVLRQLRERRNGVPVLLLSARGEVNERVEGLNAGADDYLPKPFALAELVARVRAMGRRAGEARATVLQVADLTLDTVTRLARRGEAQIELTAREYRLLEFLMRSPGRICARMTILEKVWDYDFDPGTNLVDVYVRRLRDKIDTGFEPKLIHTVRGVGYVLREAP